MLRKDPTKLQLTTIFAHVIFISMGLYYNYDFPQLYESEIISKFQVSTEKIGLLYSLYSIPNFPILIFATPMISKIGLGLTAIFANSLIFFSNILIFFAFYTKNYNFFLLGRGLLGCGGEICVITVYTIAERWFKGKFLSFAQGSCRALAFASMIFGFYFGPQFLLKTRSMQLSLLICGLVSFIGFGSSLGYFIWEKIFNKKLQVQQKSLFESGIQRRTESQSSRSLLYESRLTQRKKEVEEEKHFRLKDVKKLRGLFWMLAILFGFGSQGYFQFINFATDCLTHRYGYTFEKAKNLLSLVPLIMMILMPIFSGLIVKIGRKGYFLLGSFLIFLVNFLLMLKFPSVPGDYVYIIIGSIGVGYCLFVATIWPCMTLAAPSKATSVALGFGLNFQNLFLTVMPLVFGEINEKRDIRAYNNSIGLLAVMMMLSVLLCLVVIVVDFKTGRLLDLPENDIKVAVIRQEMEDEIKEK